MPHGGVSVAEFSNCIHHYRGQAPFHIEVVTGLRSAVRRGDSFAFGQALRRAHLEFPTNQRPTLDKIVHIIVSRSSAAHQPSSRRSITSPPQSSVSI